ncbi:calnexin [Dacryopinax primogenitus]|uniref:Calnexin n=1 Tax=Dacryopinax primogenitus (strain DJM 731) TaxID=1858805 RepID=M5GDY2_DACPD|nr:calnexin [Dacryopinax primogenitus]EJU02798.1 calnexin [Dacryopinax primogenitus]
MRAVALSTAVLIAASAVVAQDKPVFEATTIKAPFLEQFTDDYSERWTPSEATVQTPVGGETYSYVGKWALEEPTTPLFSGDKGLVAKTKAGHHAISAPFAEAVDPKGKTLVVQYEVKYQKGGNCGGGYIKLLEEGFQTSGKDFNDKTPWVIMFGPDLTCPGTKVHFIFRHKNPITGVVEEKHLKKAPKPIIGTETKLYTLIVNPDNTYEILIDGKSEVSGSLLEDFDPAVNPPKEIDDPSDIKPEDWVDAARIPDPEATKPEDWDEDAPAQILDEEAEMPEGWLEDEPVKVADPDAEKPEEWDDEEDGDWVPPMVDNPKCMVAPGCGPWKRPFKANPAYKGKWAAPMIDNPAYKGLWAPRKIDNPDYFEDLQPSDLNKIGAVGIELWTMTEDILFDNIYVGHSVADAKELAAETFDVKHGIEEAAKAKAKAEETAAAEGPASSWKDDPVAFIRAQVTKFIDLAIIDPVAAFKAMPEVGGALVATALTLLGLLAAISGLVGGSSKPVIKATKPAQKEKAPVAPAGEQKKEESAAKKRTVAQ